MVTSEPVPDVEAGFPSGQGHVQIQDGGSSACPCLFFTVNPPDVCVSVCGLVQVSIGDKPLRGPLPSGMVRRADTDPCHAGEHRLRFLLGSHDWQTLTVGMRAATNEQGAAGRTQRSAPCA